MKPSILPIVCEKQAPKSEYLAPISSPYCTYPTATVWAELPQHLFSNLGKNKRFRCGRFRARHTIGEFKTSLIKNWLGTSSFDAPVSRLTFYHMILSCTSVTITEPALSNVNTAQIFPCLSAKMYSFEPKPLISCFITVFGTLYRTSISIPPQVRCKMFQFRGFYRENF